jgi:hypothetical protein
MTFNNASNSSNTDFELSTGRFQFADRVRLDGGYAENIGIAYSAGTFTVQGANGSALSSTNPGYINLQSRTAGRQIKIAITANQTFTDGSAGGTDNQRFGLTTGVNASVDIPFYLYAVLNDSENAIAFMIGRIPHHVVAPATTKIGQSGSVVNTGQADLFSLASITVGDYDANPCLCLGSFRMRFTGATDSWTVQTIITSDGVGQFNESTSFSFPRGQYGSATSKCFANNGGTAPDDADGGYNYYILKSGFCLAKIAFPVMDTAGVGAVNLTQVYPLAADGAITTWGYLASGGVFALLTGGPASNNSSLGNALFQTSNVGNGQLTNVNLPLSSGYNSTSYYYISMA